VGRLLVLMGAVALVVWQLGGSPESNDGAGRSTVSGPSASRPSAEAGDPSSPLVDTAEVRLADAPAWSEIDDPAGDGWDTEALHEQVKKQLTALGRLLVDPELATVEALAPLLAEDFRSGPLRPAELRVVLKDGALVVERGEFPDAASEAVAGADGLALAIQQLTEPLRDATEARHEFKVVRVELTDEGVRTEQRLALSGRTASGFFEQHATWISDWAMAPGAAPRLKRLRVMRFEQTRSLQGAASLFVDATEAALGATACYQDQILRGAAQWFERIPFRTMLNLFSMPGIAVGDVNGDGLEDLYLCQDPGLPNRLFVQQPDGTAREVSAGWGVDWLEDSRGALLIDLDNDGDQDLAVAIRGHVVLAENHEGERFEVRRVMDTSDDPTSLCAFDYDADGRLDLYVCAYHPDEFLQESLGAALGAARQQFVLHDANDGPANSMFRNLTSAAGGWLFEDVTTQLGLDENNRRWSFGAAAEDMDNDGDLDLYVVNDYGRDNLYRNEPAQDGGRHFVEVGDQAGVEDSAGGMAIAWGDYDRDGWMDAYVSNMWSSAGQRVTSQSQFKPELDDEVRRRFQHFAAGNTLLHNDHAGAFTNQSLEAGVEMGRWAWGNSFGDLNNDGWEDLVVANGYMTTDDTGDL
jgi:hypothetical protein